MKDKDNNNDEELKKDEKTKIKIILQTGRKIRMHMKTASSILMSGMSSIRQESVPVLCRRGLE